MFFLKDNMSSDDIIRIKRSAGGFTAKHESMSFAEDNLIQDIGEFKTLEEAVAASNAYEDNEMFPVEYGLDIQL